jgi:UDP-N-acetylglucosamine 1-carboxyvinyltransferase
MIMIRGEGFVLAVIRVQKSPPLRGRVRVSAAKNSVLPIIAASLLTEDKVIIEEIPQLEDVKVICEVLNQLGADINCQGGRLEVKNAQILTEQAHHELIRKMRASFLVMGPMLARMGRVRISLPGGCAIGTRPIDLHLKGFSALGADITLGYGYIEARADRLVGDRIYMDFPSVGATENIMMAACLAEGLTIIENAAEEPEIVDLANFLNAMGANIKGAGTDSVKIEGTGYLHGTTHTPIPDRIEAGTLMVAAAATGGDIIVENVLPDHLKPMEAKLKEAGVEVVDDADCVRVRAGGRIIPVDIKTLPHPGFPTDMQAQMMALMTVADGTSMITETIFENRFMHVNELKRMGARIKIEGRSAVVEGVEKLTGSKVRATDLRAGAAVVIAGLMAEGETEIMDVYHIDRGYDRIEEKLRRLGAVIERVED